MKIINFNQYRKDNGSRNLTYKAWTKQYLIPLNAKITSLQDYMIYNNPQYMILNSPNEHQQIDLLDQQLQHDDDINQISLFFPAKLNWRQGFYNQSKYGDGILLWRTGETYRSSTTPFSTTQFFKFEKKGDRAAWRDYNYHNYDLYVELFPTTRTYQGVFTFNEFEWNPDLYGVWFHASHKIFVGVSEEYGSVEVTASNLEEGVTHRYNVNYDSKTGFITVEFYQLRQLVDSIPYSFSYTITPKESSMLEPTMQLIWHGGGIESDKSQAEAFKDAWIDTYINTDTAECKVFLLNSLYLVHHNNTSHYGATAILNYLEKSSYCIVQHIPKNIWYYDITTEQNVYTNHNIIREVSLEQAGINLSLFANFPSGYICILNKQPIGLNNELNFVKQLLDSYLIAPIGNGAYYILNLFGNDLIAQYTPNDLGNFINQVRINLGSNLRYVIPGDFYLKGVNSIDNKGGTFAIPNISVNENNETNDLITDHNGNLWTGGDELVAQTICSTTKEDIFIDVTYDTYVSQLKRNIIHNFNISTKEDIADFKNSNNETISIIQLQLF